MIDGFPPAGKCCRSFAIFSHGADNGALDLPYEKPDPDKMYSERDKEAHFPFQLGGPDAQHEPGASYFEDFIDSLKGNKKKGKKGKKGALCKTNKPTVTFYGCHTAKPGGIAEQVSNQGIATAGYTKVCEYPRDEKTNKYTLPRPKQPKEGEPPDPDSKFQKFSPK